MCGGVSAKLQPGNWTRCPNDGLEGLSETEYSL